MSKQTIESELKILLESSIYFDVVEIVNNIITVGKEQSNYYSTMSNNLGLLVIKNVPNKELEAVQIALYKKFGMNKHFIKYTRVETTILELGDKTLERLCDVEV